MKRFFSISLVLFVIFGYFVFSPTNIFAQDEGGQLEKRYYGLIINPTITELKLNPGEEGTGEFMLTNDYQAEETINLESALKDVIQVDGSSKIVDPDDTELVEKYKDLSMKDWISVPQKELTLDYGETQTIKFNVKVPNDASPGGHYAAVAFNRGSDAAEDANFSGTGLDQGLAHIVFVTVNGDVDESMEFVDFRTDKSWYDFAPVDFIVEMKNIGNTHTNIGGNIFVYKNDLTDPVMTFKVNEEGYFVLPLNSRSFDHIWNTGFIQWKVDSNRKKSVDINFQEAPRLPFGKYNAQLKLKHTVDGERITTEDNLSFWVIPWELILIVLLIVGIIIYLVKKRVTRKKKVKKKVLRKKVPVSNDPVVK